MKPKPLPNAETLRALLDYNPGTGALVWRDRPVTMFQDGRYSADRVWRTWRGAYAGRPALSSPMSNGYLHGAIAGVSCLAHRAIWKIVTGDDPPHDVDHINGDRTDNRWANLRACDRSANMRNRCISRNNTSGVTGVMWKPYIQRWEAYIDANGVRKYLGRFKDKEAAVAARLTAEREFGFHPNHGRARHSSPSACGSLSDR